MGNCWTTTREFLVPFFEPENDDEDIEMQIITAPEVYDDPRCINEHRRITINISGLRFETQTETLGRFPDTLLGNKYKRMKYFNSVAREFYFDRNRSAFDAILYYYQSGGRIRRPQNVCVDDFIDEIVFFELGDEVMEKYKTQENYLEKKTFEDMTCKWRNLEQWNYSYCSLAIFWITVIAHAVTLLCFCVESLSHDFVTELVHKTFHYIEMGCMAVIFLQFVARGCCCPDKLAFCLTCSSICDVASMAGFGVCTYMYYSYNSDEEIKQNWLHLRLTSLIKLVNLAGILGANKRLQTIINSFKISWRELLLLGAIVVFAVLVFSSMIYVAEGQTGCTKFRSIPHSFWWGIVTMTTVGYGDMTPTTILGRVIGGMCAVVGVICISLPIPIIASNFETLYQRQRNEDKGIGYIDTRHAPEDGDVAPQQEGGADDDCIEVAEESDAYDEDGLSVRLIKDHGSLRPVVRYKPPMSCSPNIQTEMATESEVAMSADLKAGGMARDASDEGEHFDKLSKHPECDKARQRGRESNDATVVEMEVGGEIFAYPGSRGFMCPTNGRRVATPLTCPSGSQWHRFKSKDSNKNTNSNNNNNNSNNNNNYKSIIRDESNIANTCDRRRISGPLRGKENKEVSRLESELCAYFPEVCNGGVRFSDYKIDYVKRGDYGSAVADSNKIGLPIDSDWCLRAYHKVAVRCLNRVAAELWHGTMHEHEGLHA